MADMEVEGAPALTLLPPTVEVDALPYVDTHYDSVPGMKKRVDALIQAELKTFKPKDYLAPWKMHEVSFEV